MYKNEPNPATFKIMEQLRLATPEANMVSYHFISA